MTKRSDLPRQALPNARRGADGRPRGSHCTAACRAPSSSQAHCSVCHETMRSVTDFDHHRSDGWCLDLAALGLEERGRLWATPEGHEQAASYAARLPKPQSQRLPGAVERPIAEVGTT